MPDCQTILEKCRKFRHRIYSPLKTVLMFVKQGLASDKSCKNSVNNTIAKNLCGAETAKKISASTGSYCKARQRIPGETIEQLVSASGKLPLNTSPDSWKAFGRAIKVTDGTMVKMADTKKNQVAYPQHSNQKKGLGFPLARLVVVMSITGTILDYSIGANKEKGTGEASLLRNIFDNCIETQDILLGDRYFPSYFLIADLLIKGADGIFRGQSQRHYDFRSGKKLGKKDHIVAWIKPRKPEWMTQDAYDAYAETIQVREFKVGGNVYVTTFLDEKQYLKNKLAAIYKRRWDVEIDLRSIKDVMKMDMLVCKTPDMVKKEIGEF